MVSMANLVLLIARCLELAILASVVISWLRVFGTRVPYGHPVVRVIEDTADLMLRPIRRTFRAAAGGFDFSPMIALVLLEIVTRLITRVL